MLKNLLEKEKPCEGDVSVARFQFSFLRDAFLNIH